MCWMPSCTAKENCTALRAVENMIWNPSPVDLTSYPPKRIISSRTNRLCCVSAVFMAIGSCSHNGVELMISVKTQHTEPKGACSVVIADVIFGYLVKRMVCEG